MLFLVLILFFIPYLFPIKTLEDTVNVKELADPDSQFVEVNCLLIHYKKLGHSDLELVFLHGFGSSIYSWREVLEPLSELGSVIAFDRPAFGLTERPLLDEYSGRNPYPNIYQPELLNAFMDELDINSAVLVGNSAGGMLAVQTLFEFPERVDALILISPAIFTSDGTPAFLRYIFQLPAIDRIGPLVTRTFLYRTDAFLQAAWHDPSKITETTYEEYNKPLMADNWDRALWEFVRSSRSVKLNDLLPNISIPTLVITGDDDRVIPTKDSIKVAKSIPGAQLVIIPDCGHAPQEECPEEFLDAVREFLIMIAEK